MALIHCPECGKKISDSSEKCMNCGKTITADEKNEALLKLKKKKKRKHILLLIFGVLFAAILVFCTVLTIGSIQEHKEKERQKIEQEEQSAEKNEEEIAKNKTNFIEAVQNLISSTDELVPHLQKKSIIISHTWNNAIWETKDKETDKYTLNKNGKFKDFNDAVNDCIQDIFSSNKTTKLYDAFIDAKSKYESATFDENLQSQFSEQKSEIDDFLENIQSYYNALSSPSGNYDDFTTNVNNLEYDISDNITNLSSSLQDLTSISNPPFIKKQ